MTMKVVVVVVGVDIGHDSGGVDAAGWPSTFSILAVSSMRSSFRASA